ncbi:MAG: hypothetical protein A2W11_00755 [Ignavibacteria bacterium RBG_16_35_7]|nr:MAG: hypothetical protein A2W11_00755 [Ignavibacteria bacterium RBG_16_35_7]
MANLAIFKTGQTPQYLISVNTPDYEGDPDIIINPDISAIEKIPLKYWKRIENNIAEMTADEKLAVNNTELTTRKTAADTFSVDINLIIKVLIDIGNTKWSLGKTVTEQEIINLLKTKIT